MLFILPGRTNMLAKYDGRSAIRQCKLESTMDSMTLLIPSILQIKITRLKNYQTEIDSYLMSIKALPYSCPCLTSELSKELSMKDV